MADIISEIYARSTPGEFRVRMEHGPSFSVYAKDELDAYTKALAYIEQKEKEMRTISICVTIVVLFVLCLGTFACERNDIRHDAAMARCVAAGKSFVSEDQGYSCREAAAVPRAKQD